MGVSVPLKNIAFPFAFVNLALGLKSLLLVDCFCESIMRILLIPVRSSICSSTVTPSIKSSKTITPDLSATMG